MNTLRTLLAKLLLLMVFTTAACSGQEAPVPDDAPPAEQAVDADAPKPRTYDYEVVLRDALTDTLKGSARFGMVLDQQAGARTFVIDLDTGSDFAGGLILARRGEARPAAGTYRLVASTDSTGDASDGFALVYREGMLKDFGAEQGTLTLAHVSDTLVQGTFEASLAGQLADQGRDMKAASARARGHFKARPGQTGYIIGM